MRVLRPFVTALLLCALLAPWLGCATLGTQTPAEVLERHRTLFQATTMLVMAMALREHPDWAPPVLQTVVLVRDQVAKLPQISISGVFLLVTEHLALKPEDKVLVFPVLMALEAEATLFLKDMKLTTDPEIRRVVIDLLTWVEMAARPWVPVAKMKAA